MPQIAKAGRPPKYTGHLKRHIAKLIREYNASGAKSILNADVNSPLTEVRLNAQKRNLTLIPEPLGISQPTLTNIARWAGIELRRGRPAKVA